MIAALRGFAISQRSTGFRPVETCRLRGVTRNPSTRSRQGVAFTPASSQQAHSQPQLKVDSSHHGGREASKTKRREKVWKRAERVELVEDPPQSLACFGNLSQAFPLNTCAAGRRSHLHKTISDLLSATDGHDNNAYNRCSRRGAWVGRRFRIWWKSILGVLRSILFHPAMSRHAAALDGMRVRLPRSQGRARYCCETS